MVKNASWFPILLLSSLSLIILRGHSPTLTCPWGIWLGMTNVNFIHSSADMSLHSTSVVGYRPDIGAIFCSSTAQGIIMSWLPLLPLRMRVLSTELITLGLWLIPSSLRRCILSANWNFVALHFLLPPLRQGIIFRSWSCSLHHGCHLIEDLLEPFNHSLELFPSNRGNISVGSGFLLLVCHQRRRVLPSLISIGIWYFCIITLVVSDTDHLELFQKDSKLVLFLVIKCWQWFQSTPDIVCFPKQNCDHIKLEDLINIESNEN